MLSYQTPKLLGDCTEAYMKNAFGAGTECSSTEQLDESGENLLYHIFCLCLHVCNIYLTVERFFRFNR